MTATDLSSNGHGTPRADEQTVDRADASEVGTVDRADDGRAEADAQAEAERIWLECGGEISGAELARRCGMKPRWGSKMAGRLRERYGDRADADRADGGSSAHSVDPGRAGGAVSARVVGGRSARGKAATGRTSARGKAAAGPSSARADVSALLRIGTRAAVVVVAAVAFALSYSHIRELALAAGNGAWQATLLPLSLDGLVAVCTFTLEVDRREGRGRNWLALAGVGFGLVGTVAANVIAVDPTMVDLQLVAMVFNAFPPIALAVSADLLVQSRRKVKR